MRLISGGGTGQQGSTGWNAGCTATELVGDAVYISAAGQVRQARADDFAKSRIAGFITSKPTATTCVVHSDGKVSGFQNLQAGATYFLSTTPGQMSAAEPGAGSVRVFLGIASTTTDLIVGLVEPEQV